MLTSDEIEALGAAPRRPRPPAPVPRAKPLSTLELVLALRRNPIETWTQAHFTEPYVVARRVTGHATVLNDPAAIRHVLIDNAANYRKDWLQRKILAPGLGEGLLTAEGDAWKRTRRTLAPLFTPRRVAGFLPQMREGARRLLARIGKRGPLAVIDAAEETTRVTFDILRLTLFSNAIASDADTFSRALTRYFETQGRVDPLDLFGVPDFVPRLGRIAAEPSIRFFEREVTQIVDTRRKLMAETPEAVPPDLLTALFEARDPETGAGLSEAEIGANIVTFIGAGHETTANALAWTLYLLATHPDAQAAMAEEVARLAPDDTDGFLDRRPWCRAVLAEAMRLYPPVTLIGREPLEADTLPTARGPLAVPAKSLVVITPWVLHRHRSLWAEPDHFHPERFLPGARAGIDRFAYLPFGAGPRVCIGQQFAEMEAVVVLDALLRTFRFRMAAGPEPTPQQRITLRPKGGVRLHFEPRGS